VKLPVKLSFVELFFSAHPAAGNRPAVTHTINMVIRAVDVAYGLALLNRTNQVPSLDPNFFGINLFASLMPRCNPAHPFGLTGFS
jgi:hypothetical protein